MWDPGLVPGQAEDESVRVNCRTEPWVKRKTEANGS